MRNVKPCYCRAFDLWFRDESDGYPWCTCAHGPSEHADEVGPCRGEHVELPSSLTHPLAIPAEVKLVTGDVVRATAFRRGTNELGTHYEVLYPSGEPIDVRVRDVASLRVDLLPPLSHVSLKLRVEEP